MQLSFFDHKITKEAKRKAEKMMSRYKVLEAIIESKKMNLEHKLTPNYQASESQRGNQFYSETEKLTLLKSELEEYERTRHILDIVYDSLKPVQQKMWDERYIRGRFDMEIYLDLDIPDRAYYRLKREMVAVVAEAFGFLDEQYDKKYE